jgi:hypothetical protein
MFLVPRTLLRTLLFERHYRPLQVSRLLSEQFILRAFAGELGVQV